MRRAAALPAAAAPLRAPLQRRLHSASGSAISEAKKGRTAASGKASAKQAAAWEAQTGKTRDSIAIKLAATTDTVNAGVPPKDAEAAAELSEIFGVKVTVKTIVKYEQAKTTQGNPYFVPSIEGTPFTITPTTCANKLGPRAIRRMHGVD